jgi:flagellar hook-length control protein FliK
MSGKVSTASSASAGASIAGGNPAPAAGTVAAAGNAGSDGVSAAPASRSSSSSGSNPGWSPASSSRFSSAMAEAVHSGDQAADAHIRDSSQADADGAADASHSINTGTGERPGSTTAAVVTGGASPAVTAGGPDISANASSELSPTAANSITSAGAQAGRAGGGRAAAKTSGGGRTAGIYNASMVPTDPVALAMLLAASGMQLGSYAGASTATDGASGAPANAGDDSEPAMAVAGAAAKFSAGLPAADSAPAAESAAVVGAANTSAVFASAQQARDAPPPALDAANSSTARGAGFPDESAPLQAKSVNPDTPTAQPSIMTDSTGLPELVHSFANSATQTPAVEATISVPLANGGWPQAVAAQVHWFVNNDVQSATLRLSPEHLGPVEVRIDVRESQVNVSFSAAHAETRVALEQTVPRLREIFASSGLTLGQANVQQDPRPGSQASAIPLRAAFAHAQTVEPVAVTAVHPLGLVDEYA